MPYLQSCIIVESALYFRERYSVFCLVPVHTTEKTRMEKLFQKGYRLDGIKKDDGEKAKKDFTMGEGGRKASTNI